MKTKTLILEATKAIFILLVVLSLYSCGKGKSKETFQDGDFEIEFLFEKDGCKIYRFRDDRRYIYWSNCQGRMQSDVYESNGKTGHYERMESFTNTK